MPGAFDLAWAAVQHIALQIVERFCLEAAEWHVCWLWRLRGLLEMVGGGEGAADAADPRFQVLLLCSST